MDKSGLKKHVVIALIIVYWYPIVIRSLTPTIYACKMSKSGLMSHLVISLIVAYWLNSLLVHRRTALQ